MKPSARPHTLQVGEFDSVAEAAFAFNLTRTILADAEGRSPSPDELYRLEAHELPSEQRRQEIFDAVLDELARATRHQRN